MEFIRKNIHILFGVFFVSIFFHKFFIQGLLPIPTDTIVGLYHPYRDFYSSEYPRGIPFKNMQISDPVRQQYLWKELAVSQMKQGELPLWNPYNFSGYPLMANFQTAAFYPLNFLMFITSFEYGWSLLIFSQILLAFLFMYLYLTNLKVSRIGSLIGSLSFAFCGFFVSWLEWGNIVSTGLWLPLILLSIDKFSSKNANFTLKKKLIWPTVLFFAFICSFFAGHLQTFLYLSLISFGYAAMQFVSVRLKIKQILLLILYGLIFLIVTAIQWVPTLQLISLSAREVDQVATNIPGWFIPWQNLTQFIAPDFFGNPATLNYWGVWNYGEFVGYIGLLPLILALGVMVFKRDKFTNFFGSVLIVAMICAYPSIISKIPFILEIPFISTSQPTRLLYVVDLSLAVLAAFGFDYFMKHRKRIVFPVIVIGGILSALWAYVYFNDLLPTRLLTESGNIAVTKSNLRLPTLIFGMTAVLLVGKALLPKKFIKGRSGSIVMVLVLSLFLIDIFRFADKYTVFSRKEYLYPETKSLEYLSNQEGHFRIMETDSRLLPPNFSIKYGIQSVDGYDPLYLLRYGELAAAVGRSDPDINPPFGFNRIITPQNYHDKIINIFNVEYILSLTELDNTDYEKVFEENETRVYRNNGLIERAFFAGATYGAKDKYDAIGKLFEHEDNLDLDVIVEGANYQRFDKMWSTGSVEITKYSANEVRLSVDNDEEGFLVLTDTYYPTWKAEVDGVPTEIFIANYNFRGVIVPAGSKEVIFTNHIF